MSRHTNEIPATSQVYREDASVVMAPSIRTVNEIGDLIAIFDPTVNVVSLRREPTQGLIEEGRLASDCGGFQKLLSIKPAESSQSISERIGGFPHIAEDMRLWVELLSEISACECVGVRMARVGTAVCPRFHVDRVTLRLVLTYRGPGTEFVSNEYVDRSHLGSQSTGHSDEDSGLLRTSNCIQNAETFDAVFLKGESWPGNAGKGAVHRSPFASEESPRLVMTLDPL